MSDGKLRQVIRLFLSVVFMIVCALGASAWAQADPWGVILYEKPLWVGSGFQISMGTDTRQKLVANWEGKVRSITVGEKVAVAVFEHPNFEAEGWSCADQIFVDNASPVEQNISSLIVFPKEAGFPMGVCLWDERSTMAPGGPIQHVTFFPLPEQETDKQATYTNLGQVNLDQNANDVRTYHGRIELELFEQNDVQGVSLNLPGPAGWAGIDPYWDNPAQRVPLAPMPARGINFGQFEWSDRAASLVVSWRGPALLLGPPGLRFSETGLFTIYPGSDMPGKDYRAFPLEGTPEVCEKACAGEANCKAFTWVRPGLQREQAVCWLKSEAPQATPKSGLVSGSRLATPTEGMTAKMKTPWTAKVGEAFSVREGQDLPGSDYKSFALSGGPEECQKACGSDPQCRAFTWVKPGAQGTDAVCWLKSSLPEAKANANCVSGFRTPW